MEFFGQMARVPISPRSLMARSPVFLGGVSPTLRTKHQRGRTAPSSHCALKCFTTFGMEALREDAPALSPSSVFAAARVFSAITRRARRSRPSRASTLADESHCCGDHGAHVAQGRRNDQRVSGLCQFAKFS